MDVLLLHDPTLPPFDLWQALVDEGHRVASHGTDARNLATFLDAMTWTPEVAVVDYRGDATRARSAAEWLTARAPWRERRVIVVHADPESAPDGAVGVPDAAALPRALRA